MITADCSALWAEQPENRRFFLALFLGAFRLRRKARESGETVGFPLAPFPWFRPEGEANAGAFHRAFPPLAESVRAVPPAAEDAGAEDARCGDGFTF